MSYVRISLSLSGSHARYCSNSTVIFFFRAFFSSRAFSSWSRSSCPCVGETTHQERPCYQITIPYTCSPSPPCQRVLLSPAPQARLSSGPTLPVSLPAPQASSYAARKIDLVIISHIHMKVARIMIAHTMLPNITSSFKVLL